VTELRDRYGDWAVVTGGSEGVGEALAWRLAAEGLNLVLLARTASRLDDLADRLRRAHPDVDVVTRALDLSLPEAAEQVVELVANKDVGLLAVNAGANSLRGTFLEQDPADVARAVQLSVHLPMALVARVAPSMVERGRGAVLLLGSLAGYLGQPQLAVYSADKAWQRIFCESLWLELQPLGVDVLHLVLGVTRTPAMERAGLSFDTPGLVVAEPDEVAAFALANLDRGPVLVVPGNEHLVEARGSTDRARLVGATARRMGLLLPPRATTSEASA
jgi:short-subunit dehydrogenase